MKKTLAVAINLIFMLILMMSWLSAPQPAAAAGATFVVNSTGDETDLDSTDGLCKTSLDTCTLRAAIQQANKEAATQDTITFNIPLPLAIIYVQSALPTIYTPMHIQGPNIHNGGAVVLSGLGNDWIGLVINPGSAGSSVSDFDVRDFGKLGIYINTSSNITISDCVIGSTAGPTIPGNLFGGIAVYDSSNVQVLDNLIPGNGGAPATNSAGISIQKGGGNTIQGNKIGTDVTGTSARGNVGSGITIDDSDGNLIGGAVAGDGNLISGNGGNGILISGGSDGTIIKGNSIGTNLAGTAALPNGGDGIQIFSAENTQIGGAEAGAGNLISGNTLAGIRHSLASNSVIYGNTIGLSASGDVTLPNQSGLLLYSGEHNKIGGTGAGQANIIGGNATDGVRVYLASKGNSIVGNAIYDNGGLGIDLLVDGEPDSSVTPNDDGDADTGANDLQNFPILTEVLVTPTAITVTGYLNSLPSQSFTLHFYGNDACDPSNHGEGQHYLGVLSVNTNASHLAPFTKKFTTSTEYDCIAATATDAQGNTSEFSGMESGAEELNNFLPLILK